MAGVISGGTRDRRHDTLLLVVSTAICIAALYVKEPRVFHLPQFYAEEGRLFFADAYNERWASLFYTANGYFHLLPRLLANLTLTLGVPYRLIPAVFVYGCLPVYFFLWSRLFTRLPLAPAAKVFLVLTTVLLPLGNEIFMNQTNLQWVMALIPVVLYCGEPARDPFNSALDYAALVLCVFTGPYVLFLFPVFLGAAIVERQVRARALFLTICLIGAIACVFSLLHFGTVDRIHGATKATAYGYLQLAFRTYFYPVFSTYVDSVPEWAVLALTIALPVAFLVIARSIYRTHSRFAWVSFIAGFPLFAATLISYGRHPGLPSPIYNAIRNFYLPMVLLLWSLITITRFDRPRTTAWALAFCWFAVQIPFIEDPRRMPDQRWEKYSERITDAETLTIPITPLGWNMTLKARTPAR